MLKEGELERLASGTGTQGCLLLPVGDVPWIQDWLAGKSRTKLEIPGDSTRGARETAASALQREGRI